MAEPTFCAGVADLAARYDHFVVDQWGVLHDGHAPYPDAIDVPASACGRPAGASCCSATRASAPGSTARACARSASPTELFDDVVTSGEATWRALAERTDPFFRELGRRCILWSRYGDRSLVEELDLEVVQRRRRGRLPAARRHRGRRRGSRTSARRARARRAARDLPMVCANPDIVAVQPRRRVSAWRRARSPATTRSLGGRVVLRRQAAPPGLRAVPRGARQPGAGQRRRDRRFGRPRHRRRRRHEPRYRPDHERHPRRGLRSDRRPEPNQAALERLEGEYGVRPRWLLPRFRWEI